MTNTQIKEHNRLVGVRNDIKIALFMGWVVDNTFPDQEKVYRLGKQIELDTTLKFRHSWDELMPVVLKLMKIKKEQGEWGSVTLRHDVFQGLEATYKEVVRLLGGEQELPLKIL